MGRGSLNPFSRIFGVPYGVVIDVNVNFDTRIACQGQMFGAVLVAKMSG